MKEIPTSNNHWEYKIRGDEYRLLLKTLPRFGFYSSGDLKTNDRVLNIYDKKESFFVSFPCGKISEVRGEKILNIKKGTRLETIIINPTKQLQNSKP